MPCSIGLLCTSLNVILDFQCLKMTSKHSYTIVCADVSPIVLNGQRLPYVSSDKHPGNTLDSGVKNKDLQIKRGIKIGKMSGVLQDFYFSHPCSNVVSYGICFVRISRGF